MAENRVEANAHNAGGCPASNAIHGHINDFLVRTGLRSGVSELQLPCFTAVRAEIALMSGGAFAITHHAFSSGAGRISDGNGSHASTLKSPSYTKSVSWQHHPHYDSASSYENDQLTYTPGADDNASGVAGLLELARLLHQQVPKTGVQLVAYASEEPPFFRSDEMGSAVHAASLERPVKLMIALEMIGYYDSAPGSQNYPYPAMSWLYPDRGDFIAVVGRIQDINAVRR